MVNASKILVLCLVPLARVIRHRLLSEPEPSEGGPDGVAA